MSDDVINTIVAELQAHGCSWDEARRSWEEALRDPETNVIHVNFGGDCELE